MKFLCGDECGQVKVVSITNESKKGKQSKKDGKHHHQQQEEVAVGPQIETHAYQTVDKKRAVCYLVTDPVEPTDRFWVARPCGEVQCLSISEPNDLKSSFKCGSTLIGMEIAEDGKLFTCTTDGLAELREFPLNSEEGASSEPRVVASINIGPGFKVARIHPKKPNLFAVGGTDRPLSVYDFSQNSDGKPVPIFKAKGLGNDHLDLERRTDIMDLAFLPGAASHILTADKFGWIRLYDTRHPTSRKPIAQYPVTESNNFSSTTKTQKKITCPTHIGVPIHRLITTNDRIAVIADTIGNLYQFDFKAGAIIGSYKGIAGAVIDVALNYKYIAAVGLDRHLRIYDWKTRRLVKKVYLKQRQCKLAIVQDVFGEDEAGESDEEDIWEQMETETIS